MPVVSVPHPEAPRAARPRRTHRRFWCAVGALFLGVAAAGYFLLQPPNLERNTRLSALVLARDGSILRGFLSADGKWRMATAATDVDPLYRRMLIATEDRRFESHAGVDPLAVARAAAQWATHGRVVSGASTLTMQAVRLLERRPRTLAAKLAESGEALALERRLDKDAILGIYLTLAPFGGNLEGVRAASIAYFGKEPRRLTLAEAALLVALPQSPEHRRLDRHPDVARQARDRVLARMVEEGVVSREDADRAIHEPLPTMRKEMPILAPHSTDQAVATEKNQTLIRL
ncbi:MAG: transglycosylase domain-containing protein, partial [Alphaproteobacteria bacterium]|nr:transglycosylase domain-containing protein [Alphaproteobacteria bacterium]